MPNIELSFPGSGAAPSLSVRHFHITEGLSAPFEVTLVAASPDPDIDFDHVLGKPARCRVDRGPLGARSWTGLCSSIEQVETEPDGLSLYSLRIVPALWLLSQRRGHRVFQRLAAPAIARAILAGWGIDVVMRLDEASFARHEHRVQYGESDLAFLSRLLGDAGVSFFVEADGDEERLVLTDAPERGEERGAAIAYASEPGGASDDPYVSDVRVARELRPEAVVIDDFDPHRPQYRASYQGGAQAAGGAKEAKLVHRAYVPGVALVDTDPPAPGTSDTPVADDKGRVRSDDREGHGRAARMLEGLRAGRAAIGLSTNLVTLAPGVVFSIAGAPQPELGAGRRFCVVTATIAGSTDGEWRVSVVAAPANGPVRAAQQTPRPRIEGVQSALVVGPPGDDIHVDELGRVRLRFPWDREAAASVERSPWVRVADGWAGAGWGMIAVPRVGQEVLVSFLEGDPDQPIVVGRAFNASAPHPYPLPGSETKSVWRSRSTAGTSGASETSGAGASGGYHEIAFEDRRGHESVSVLSERDLEKVARRDAIDHTAGEHTAITGGHVSTTIGGDDRVTAGEVHRVAIGAGGATRREIVAKRITLTTGGATIVLDGPDITVTAESGIRIQAGGTVSIQGGPFVHVNPPAVTAAGEAVEAAAPDQVVWFKLASEGTPLAGARCHIVFEDGTVSGLLRTDGNGLVRLPVSKPGQHRVHLGAPPVGTSAGVPYAAKKQPAAQETPEQATPEQEAAHAANAANAGTGGVAAPVDLTADPVAKTPAQAHPKAKPTEHEVPVKLEIVEPKAGSTFHLHAKPSMPEIPLQARVLVQGAPVETGSVRWEIHVRGSYRVRSASGSGYRMQPFKLAAGHARTAPGKRVRHELDTPAIVGGDLEIKAIFHGGPELGDVTATKVVKGCKVLGKNPPRREVEAFIEDLGGELSWLFLRLFCHESAHALDQFAAGSGGGNTPGFPLYGPPSGVGIVQRDPVAGEWEWPKRRITKPNNFFPRIFWDWKKNLREGISSFKNDYIERARRDLELLRDRHPHLPAYPQGVLLRAAIRRYNGGTEYAAGADGRHYVVSPAYTNNPSYVSSVLGDPHVDAGAHPVPADARATRWPR